MSFQYQLSTKRPREEPSIPGTTGYKVKVVPGTDNENATYQFKYTVTGNQFVGSSNDVNVLQFHHPDIHLGQGKYVMELDRVDLQAYCAAGSLYGSGRDQVYSIVTSTAYNWAASLTTLSTANATSILLIGVGATGPTATVGTYVLVDQIPSANIPTGMYPVTRSMRNYTITGVFDTVGTYSVSGNLVTVGIASSIPGFPAGTPPTIAGGAIRLDAQTGYPAAYYPVVSCTATSLTFDFGSPAPTPVATFTGAFASYIEVSHGLPYIPGPFSGGGTITVGQYNFVAESQMCLVYAQRFSTTMSIGQTYADTTRSDSKQVILEDQAVVQSWEALGTLRAAGSSSMMCDSYGQGNTSANGYKLYLTYSNPYKTSTTQTQGAVVPFDTLSFQLTMNDAWMAQSKAPHFDVTIPGDFLVDKTYYFTLRPLFLQ